MVNIEFRNKIKKISLGIVVGIGGLIALSRISEALSVSNPSANSAYNYLQQPNTWSALQTFGNNISFGGKTANFGTLDTSSVVQYNGTNWITTPYGLPSGAPTAKYFIQASSTTASAWFNLFGTANTWTLEQTIQATSGNPLKVGTSSLNSMFTVNSSGSVSMSNAQFALSGAFSAAAPTASINSQTTLKLLQLGHS